MGGTGLYSPYAVFHSVRLSARAFHWKVSRKKTCCLFSGVFPCNQFGEQNPEDGAKTIKLCQINYGVTFPIFEIVQVNGEGTHPLFNYLKHEVDFREFGKANMQEKMLAESIIQIAPSFLDGRNIRWNFTKFLVDNQGNIVERFEPTDSQLDIEQAIEKIL